MNQQQLRRLETLLALPTAPFREQPIIRHLQALFGAKDIPHFTDPVGNIVVGAASATDYQRLLQEDDDEPLRVYIAHMDHPGFHGREWLPNGRLQIAWHGGSPLRHLNQARAWLGNDSGIVGHGRLRKVQLLKSKMAIATAEVQLDRAAMNVAELDPVSLSGGLAFARDVSRQGKRIYARAVDDLVGVFAIAELALSAFAKRRTTNRQRFIGLLTRGEEVGFVGAIGHLETGWLQGGRRPLVCVSLEASRTLPGALIGKGPVVRLGDRRTIFNTDATQVLTQLAERLLPGRHQRRIMDGGSCEATATTAYGLPTLGLSVPLGNYHNQGYEGGWECAKSLGPAPEFAHLDDIAGYLRLCQGLLKTGLPWSAPWQPVRLRLLKNFRHYRCLL